MVDPDIAHAEYDRAHRHLELPRPSAGSQKLFWGWNAVWCVLLLYLFLGQPFAGRVHEQGAMLGWYQAPLFGALIAVIGGWIILLVGRWMAERRR